MILVINSIEKIESHISQTKTHEKNQNTTIGTTKTRLGDKGGPNEACSGARAGVYGSAAALGSEQWGNSRAIAAEMAPATHVEYTVLQHG